MSADDMCFGWTLTVTRVEVNEQRDKRI